MRRGGLHAHSGGREGCALPVNSCTPLKRPPIAHLTFPGMYGLSARSAAMVAATPDEWVRLSGCEDASLGLLLLTLRSRHVDDRRICHEWCETDSLGEWLGGTEMCGTDMAKWALPGRPPPTTARPPTLAAVWPEMYCHTNCNNSATLVGLHKDPTCKNRTANFGSPWHPSPAGGLHVLKPGQLDRMDWA